MAVWMENVPHRHTFEHLVSTRWRSGELRNFLYGFISLAAGSISLEQVYTARQLRFIPPL